MDADQSESSRSADDLEREVARLRDELAQVRGPTEVPPRRSAVRRAVVATLVALSVVGIAATASAFWLHERVMETDVFVSTVRSAVDDPAVTEAVGDYISDQVFVAIDLEERLERQLADADQFLAEQLQGLLGLGELGMAALERLEPPKLADLAAPLAAAVETPVREGVNAFLGSAEFRDGLEAAIRTAHPRIVALLRGDEEALPNVVVETGEVRLDLVPVTAAALRSVVEGGVELVGLDVNIPRIPAAAEPAEGVNSLANALGTELLSDFGQVVIMSEARLDELQAVVRAVDRFPWVLLAVTVVLIAVALAVSSQRRRTILHLAIGTALGLFVAVVALRLLHETILDAIADPGGRAAAETILLATLGSLRATLVALILMGSILGVALILSERGWLQTAWASTLDATRPQPGGSKADRFVTDFADPLRAAGVAAAAVALFLTGIGGPQVVIIGVLLGLYLWAIAAARRRTASGGATGESP